ncbi:MAG: DUF494 domain-containing protein [Gammaproteobacteria bacterium]|nr:DUF494 domain-containing protein [Gammaproteobacteria bacterium]
MRQNIIDVLAYIFDDLSKKNFVISKERLHIINKLQQAGFSEDVIFQAFEWLHSLVDQEKEFVDTSRQTLRIFSPEECLRLNVECRNFILALERANIIDMKMREIIINQLLDLNHQQLQLIDVKWVTLIVLLSRPENSTAKQLRNFLLETTAQKV